MRSLLPVALFVLLIGLVGGAPPSAAQTPDSTAAPYGLDNQLDINRADLAQIEALPIPKEVAEAILHYRTYISYFDSLYDLLKVPGMTPEMLQRIKPMVFITPIFQLEEEDLQESERRAREGYYVLQRYLSQEGANEGLVDSYIDQLRTPRNINNLNFYDLVSYQNVSPVDAVAVLREKSATGKIENWSQLRSASGITYWGARNLRDFIQYSNPAGPKRVTGDYQFRIYNTPYFFDTQDVMNEGLTAGPRNYQLNTYGGLLSLNTWEPYLTNKIRLRYGPNFKFGLLTHRNLGEQKWNETQKFYLEAENLRPTDTALGRFQVNSIALGHYHVGLGQGLLMDATDFFQPRRTGFGYNVRDIGVSADISRSDEFTLRGAAADLSLGRARGIFWYSQDDKDAILNPASQGGSFNRYFTMLPRIDNDTQAEIRQAIDDGTLTATFNDTSAFLPWRDAMKEKMLGGNLKVEIQPGTYVGVTGVQIKTENNVFDGSLADRWDPTPDPTLVRAADTDLLEPRDAEIGQAYNSTNLGNYRRLWGAEAQTVLSNVSVAAEYGKLETSSASGFFDRVFGNGPEAFIANAYVQYENFNFLALYRDYDVGYDNPYNRAFSEDTRYEQTLIDGNPFRLRNPYYSQLAYNNPQPKSEQGWYFFTRYQPTRQFTLTGLEYDTWKRKADGADLWRVTVRAEYRPIFPLRFRIRQRVSARDENNVEDVRRFKSWDTRLELRANLSHYDQISFLYSTSNVTFAGRGRLSGPAPGGSVYADTTAQFGIPGNALQGVLTHNFNDFLTLVLSAEVYDGFLYNYEDNEFIVIDGNGFRNWVMLRSRLSENLTWRFKWTYDYQQPRTYVDIRNFGDLVPPTPDATNVTWQWNSYRFQLDFSF